MSKFFEKCWTSSKNVEIFQNMSKFDEICQKMLKNVEILKFLLPFADKSPKWPPQLVPGTKWEQYDGPDHPTPQWALSLSTAPPGIFMYYFNCLAIFGIFSHFEYKIYLE